MPKKLKILDLFSGIGGFSLGFERTDGFETIAFCEIDKFARKVLRTHWPEVPIYDDIRTLSADRLNADGLVPDIIVGGFPCQDISVAGKGAGLAGERSGLWREYARLIGEIRPRYVIVENVAALLNRGLGDVLGDLAALGFDAEWHCIPASVIGAPHRRDRIWIIAYHAQWGWGGKQTSDQETDREIGRSQGPFGGLCGVVSDTNGARLEGWLRTSLQECARERVARKSSSCFSNADSESAERPAITWSEHRQWLVEPDVGRVAYGIPARVDRLKTLGNAVVPQIPEMIGRAILNFEKEMSNG